MAAEARNAPTGGIFDLRIFSLQCMFLTKQTIIIRKFHCSAKNAHRKGRKVIKEKRLAEDHGSRSVSRETFFQGHVNPITKTAV
jgi:hypothetical protein